MVGSHIQSSTQRENDNKIYNFREACMATLSCGCSLTIDRHLVCGFFIKTLIIIFISTNISKSYACEPLGPYMSSVDNSIDPITSY